MNTRRLTDVDDVGKKKPSRMNYFRLQEQHRIVLVLLVAVWSYESTPPAESER